MAAAPKHGSRRLDRRRGQVVGPVISVIAVLAVTVPVTVVMVGYSESSRLTDLRADRNPSGGGAPTRTLEPSRDGGARPDQFPAGERSTQVVTPAVVLPPALARTRGLPTPPTVDPSTTVPSMPQTPRPAPSTTSSRPPSSPLPSTPSSAPSESPTTGPTSPADPPPGAGQPAAFEAEVRRLTNAERTAHGCGPLAADPALAKAAGGHATDMVTRRYFDHTSPEGLGPAERVAAAGFSGDRIAENIAMGYGSPKAAVDGWMKSSGHRANILNCDLDRLGVGFDPGRIAEGYAAGSWVQNFGSDN